MTAVLELRDVIKTYAGTPPVCALAGISLRVVEGEMVAVVGPSGSGKSTLLSLLGALDRPSSGSVVIDGHDTGQLSDRRLAALRSRRIGFVFQQFLLLEGLTAVDNVATALLYRGVSAAARRRAALEALERVGLARRAMHRPSQLSGGEQQRVAIARAVVGAPAVVLADEPTGNLDSRAGQAIVDLLSQMNADGTTVVVVTHDRDIASALPRVVTLHDGLVENDTRTAERVGA